MAKCASRSAFNRVRHRVSSMRATASGKIRDRTFHMFRNHDATNDGYVPALGQFQLKSGIGGVTSLD